MTINEMISKLQEIANNGYGNTELLGYSQTDTFNINHIEVWKDENKVMIFMDEE